MLDRILARAAGAARGAIPSLALAGALALAAFGPPIATGNAVGPAEPADWVQVVVKHVEVLDDRDGTFSGKGEMTMEVALWRCVEGIPPPCLNQYSVVEGVDGGPVTHVYESIKAGTGDVLAMDRVVPRDGDNIYADDLATPELGFAILPGTQYVLRFSMSEWDTVTDSDTMGHVYHYLDTGKHGLGLGTHVGRARGADGFHVGDYIVTYEIRRTPRPDLRPGTIQVHDLVGTANKLVCMSVTNHELIDAGPFEVALRVNGTVPAGGRATAGRLAGGTSADLCVEVALPTSGRHTLAAVVDEPRALAEYSETNNIYEQEYIAPPKLDAPAATSTPAPKPSPSAALPDLIVSEIKVNGRVPDGKDDCNDGKNAVTVVVKNAGPKRSGDFFVRLVVDGDEGGARVQEVDYLEAGKEEPVTFEGVRLKKGPHGLIVIADWTTGTGITESNEGNNTLKVSAGCNDDH